MNTSFDSRLTELLATIHQNGKLIRADESDLPDPRKPRVEPFYTVEPIADASVA
jgi:hypothetical protein